MAGLRRAVLASAAADVTAFPKETCMSETADKYIRTAVIPDPFDEPLLRVPNLIGFGGMRSTALYDAVVRGDIPSVRVGRRLFIPNSALRERFQLPERGELSVGTSR
jgi:hypothetical protein